MSHTLQHISTHCNTDGTQGYARIWVTISCNLRDDDRVALSELGFSRDASGRVRVNRALFCQ